MSVPFLNVSKAAKDGVVYPCPCCGFRTLKERAGYEICPVCCWEDDGQDDHDADRVRGGPNGSLSLSEGRKSFIRHGACDKSFLGKVRPPLPEER